jgi:FkbM family methyltransferase
MTAHADLTPYGAHSPGAFASAVLAVTRRLPANWMGLRLSMPLRRLAIDALGDRPVDTSVWNARMRLYPARNSCEKNALFTPQMSDVVERSVLAAAIDCCVSEGKTFRFVDVGANVGLYSLFVAARAGAQARVLALEPQPGIVDRLMFNLRSNPGFNIMVVPQAVADREGDIELVIDGRDSGGSHLNLGTQATRGAETVQVHCRPLLALLHDAGFSAIDALKIDIEGAEAQALAPFLNEAPRELLPGLVLIEDRPASWPIDLFGLIERRGYVICARSRQNVVFRRTAA